MKKYQKIIITALLWSLITIIFSAGIALAQEDKNITYKMQVGMPGTAFADTITMDKGSTYYIALFVQTIYQYGISVVAILAAVMIMAGGIIWLTSAGSQERVGKAKDLIIGSLTGLILLFGSWVVLNTINPALVNFKLRSVDNIAQVTLGCCQYTQYLTPPTFSFPAGWTGGTGVITSKYMNSAECSMLPYGGGKIFSEEYAPRSERLMGGCEKVGCCNLWIRQFGKFVLLSGSMEPRFPSTANNCPDISLGVIGLNEIYFKFTEERCESQNVKDCKYLSDGTQCFARTDNSWMGWLYSSQCLYDGQCGYCYNGSCLPLLGKVGEICGVDGNIGECLSGNNCPSPRQKINEGRRCNNGVCCDYSTVL